MSEEIQENVPAEQAEPAVAENATTEAPNMEDQAKGQGWTSKNEFKGNPDDWVSAEAYVARGPIMDQVKKLKRSMNSIVEYNQKLEHKLDAAEIRGYEQAVSDLEEKRQTAISEGDANAVEQYNNKINQKNQQINQTKQTPQPVAPEVQEFVARNRDWLEKDPRLAQLAMQQEGVIRLEHPEYALDELYEELDKRMAKYTGKETKESAKPKAQPKPSYVAPPAARAGVGTKEGKSYSLDDLTSDAKNIYIAVRNAAKDKGKDITVDQWAKRAISMNMEADVLRGK